MVQQNNTDLIFFVPIFFKTILTESNKKKILNGTCENIIIKHAIKAVFNNPSS